MQVLTMYRAQSSGVPQESISGAFFFTNHNSNFLTSVKANGIHMYTDDT